MINIQRRKTVMARSIKLGHCVCNPRLPCPCDTFKKYNVCACAGEKMPPRKDMPGLTRMVRKPGCASKIGQADLLRVVGNLPAVTDPDVLLGTAAGDDAGVYRISDDLALVQTVDVFTPVVDDPYRFGAIAAANSLSDIYAMGAVPRTALSIIGFPIDEYDSDIMEQILRGGTEKLAEAGCALIGGHSINDEEIKFGFAVTGWIHPDRVVARGKARPGDALVLTKPLGTGMISFAGQIERLSRSEIEPAAESMATLNRDAAELMQTFAANACTDITGFGLAGHLVEMARGSGVVAEIELAELPVFTAAEFCLRHSILPGSVDRNEEFSIAWVMADPDAAESLPIIFDPQTSGGLLVSLPMEAAREYISALHERGHRAASIIGRIDELPSDRPEGFVQVNGTRIMNIIGDLLPDETGHRMTPNKTIPETKEPNVSEQSSSCCNTGGSEGGDAAALFGEFMKLANQPVLIEKRAKKLMAIALAVAQRCRPCLVAHIKGALAMGITQAEIDEAAQLAVAFAGCPALMLYKEVSAELQT